MELVDTLLPKENQTLQEMQLGVTVSGSYIISVSLSGALNFWNLENVGQESKLPNIALKVHRKSLVAWGLNNSQDLVTLDKEGRIIIHSFLQKDSRSAFLDRWVSGGIILPEDNSLIAYFGSKLLKIDLETLKIE